jgi:CPA2 family monovalent cation:H+ antiporter-2
MRRQVFGLGALELLLAAALLAAGSWRSARRWVGALAIGLALALSSTALVLPISGTQTPVGKAALAMLLFEDIAIVPIIFVLGALAPRAGTEGLEGLFDTLWMGLLVVLAMMVVGPLALPRLFAQAARTKSPELFLAVSMLVVIGASLATDRGRAVADRRRADRRAADRRDRVPPEIEGIMEPFKGSRSGCS